MFLTGPEDDAALLASRPGSHAATAELKTMSLDPSGLPTDDSWIGRMARDLAAFFKIANVINSTRDVQALERDLLDVDLRSDSRRAGCNRPSAERE